MAAILVAGTILFLLLLDWGARRLGGGAAEPDAASAPSVWADPSGMLPVAGTFLSPAHLWARIAEDGSVRLGVDAFARKAIGGDPTFLLPRPGHRVEKGDELLATVRGDGRLGFPSPFSGTIRAVRPSPELSDTEDWLLVVEPERLGVELGAFRIAEQAREWLSTELGRFREFVVGRFQTSPAFATLPDGGLPADGVLALLPETAWQEFETEFLAKG